MERLTTRCSGYAVMAWEHEEKHTTQERIDMLTDRLAAYEEYCLVRKASNGNPAFFERYWKEWVAYCHKPEEDKQ